MTAAGVTPSSPTSTYAYGYTDANWGDKLTSYRGQTITYDEIGNPLSYYNGSSYTFTWQNGRQLATAAKGSRTLSFEYNDEGIRTSKTVNGVEHVYYLNGSRIIAELWGNSMCIYLYDTDGSPIGMQYRTTSYAEGEFDTFWFTKNVHGDIVSVYNDAGTKLLTYHYDAWGNVSTQWHTYTGSDYNASYNPFKYRGYYHDSETGFYYLNSRYYDPATGRFLNADGLVSTGQGLLGYNMFAYCNNNPVNSVDFGGNIPIPVVIAIAVGAFVAGIVVGVGACIIVSNIKQNHNENAENEKNIKEEIKESYTQDEAEEEIENLYSELDVSFESNRVRISNSHTVTDKYDRQKISMILSRTEGFNREFDDISSEWLFHNMAYDMYFMRDSADPADLDYVQDPRFSVRVAYNTLEFLGLE